MSGVINTVIDSWAFPGSIACSRSKKGQEAPCSGARMQIGYKAIDTGTPTAAPPSRPAPICFHILHWLFLLLCGVNLPKPLDGVNPAFRSEFSGFVDEFSY